MRLKNIIATILLLASVQTVYAQKVILYKTTGETIKCAVSELDSIVFAEDEPIIESHEWVDLGLPSGTLWATCNVGANNPEEYGDYFAWGETEPKTSYDTSNYKFNRGSGKMTKYCTLSGFGSNGMIDDLTELEPEDDAATTNWGNDWQMPNKAQMEELLEPAFTTTEWTSMNDFNGMKIISKKNGNWIFFPAGGFIEGSSRYRAGSFGSCWSRSLYESSPNDAYDCAITYNGIFWGRDRRYMGEMVRPVRVEKIQRTLVSEIILSDAMLTLQPEESKSLTATILPADAFFTEVTWESSDEVIAVVNSEGLVTAYLPGTCTIICRAIDGSGVYAECQVTVE
ncbi:MAG: Ig-like domain-containing protein [Bacteroidaceae bacterium]|nr:Ig-like domain-containing protein [Bacteroidaceae bacterium]